MTLKGTAGRRVGMIAAAALMVAFAAAQAAQADTYTVKTLNFDVTVPSELEMTRR